MHEEERKSPSNVLLEILANDHMYKTTTLAFSKEQKRIHFDKSVILPSPTATERKQRGTWDWILR